MTYHLRLGPNDKVIVGLVEMSHLHVKIKGVIFGAAFSSNGGGGYCKKPNRDPYYLMKSMSAYFVQV